MVITIKVEGIEFIQSKFTQLGKDFKKDVVGALQESALLLQEEIQNSIEGNRAEPRSVDTGEFLASVAVTNSSLGASVSSDVPQAVFMEYGTSTIAPRQHFRNSLNRLQPIIVKKVEDTLTQDLEK